MKDNLLDATQIVESIDKLAENKEINKEENPILAICYDFDHTLTPDDMQAQGFIQDLGYKNINDFWQTANDFGVANGMDSNACYMYKMQEEARAKGTPLTRRLLQEYGGKIKLYPAVEDWFERINKYGKERGITVEHYIISSGLAEMIEGTPIAKYFKKIYSCCFLYNNKGEAVWPAQIVNYTNKTQFLFRIEKGILEATDSRVNDFMPAEDVRVPFRNIVYLGDSATDIPCMLLVNRRGGHSIGVYCPDTKDKEKIYDMFQAHRIKYIAEADYSEGSRVEKLLKAIIDKTVAYEDLEQYYETSKIELEEYAKNAQSK